MALVFGASCSGVLTIDPAAPCERDNQCGIGYVCDEDLQRCVGYEDPCSTDDPLGYCPVGQECIESVCHCTDPVVCDCPGGECSTTPCDCLPEQGCDAGQCLDIVTSPDPDANDCAPERPDGLCTLGHDCCDGECCPLGEVCAGGHCVPVRIPCSPANPTGYCEQPGFACLEGSCVADGVCGCTPPALPCCPAGEACSGDTCQPVTCTADVIGVCPAEQVCGPDGCEGIPCSPNHLGGSCPAQEYCSDIGACIPVGECRVTTDCGSTQYCSTTNVCREKGLCASDGDCEVGQAPPVGVYGQGYECVSSACVPRDTCAAEDECVTTEYCSGAGNCLAYPECDGVGDCPTGVPGEPDEFCSYDGYCIPIETCATDRDCPTGEFCAGNQCLTSGTCFEDAHCPPAHECQGAVLPDTPGTCAPLREGECTSNDFTSLGCAAGVLTCCTPGETCCDPYTERCSAATNCIPAGRCVDDSDCLAGATSCIGYYCVPTVPKTELECVTGEKYVVVQGVGGCIPEGNCVLSSDCAAAEYCDPEYRCQPVPGCDNRELDAGGVVPPNVLIVIDRSGSMNLCGAGSTNYLCGYPDSGSKCDDTNATCESAPWCDPDPFVGNCEVGRECYDYDGAIATFVPECVCAAGNPAIVPQPVVPRWREALNAIDLITQTYAGRVNFGLSIYPRPNLSPSVPDGCGLDCNWFTCSGGMNTTAGTIDAPMGASNSFIMQKLGLTAPGGGTPTAPTLRAVLGLPDRGGLDDPERANAVLLVTDGEPIGDSEEISVCAPPCNDGTQDGDETGVDCGGSCSPCEDGLACAVADDCQSGVCRGGLCRPGTCANGVIDVGTETDIDCGGTCGGCAAGLACAGPQDCVSGECELGRCLAATCTDGTENGSETDVDCGGACVITSCDDGTICMVGDVCADSSDCVARGACGDGTPCVAGEACTGGGECIVPGVCADGAGCSADHECASGVCQAGTCQEAACGNAVLDLATETDTDCGGICGPCADGESCGQDGDCASGWCNTNVCETPLCANGVRDSLAENGVDNGETDVDCGGGSCAPCGPYRTCAAASDCAGESPECTALTAQDARVNAAIGKLYSVDPRVKTFVVGFNMGAPGTYSSTLNCNSVYGRTARSDQGNCSSLTTASCATGASAACYYEASDQATLETAFDDILTKVSSCRYLLSDAVIPYWDAVYAYLQSPDGTRVRVERYTGWDLNGVGPTIEFFGTACEQLKTGIVMPLVTIHCTPSGG